MTRPLTVEQLSICKGWHQPSKYFDNISAINVSRDFSPCSENRLSDNLTAYTYWKLTGDSAGVVPVSAPDSTGQCCSLPFWPNVSSLSSQFAASKICQKLFKSKIVAIRFSGHHRRQLRCFLPRWVHMDVSFM